MRIVALLLRFYSYIFEFLLSLGLLILGIIGATSNNGLSLDMLPWTGAALTHWLTGLGIIGLVCTILAILNWFRFLFPLWALFVVIMLFRAYVLSPYTFSGPAGFKQAVVFFLLAVIAFIGSLFEFGRRERGRKV